MHCALQNTIASFETFIPTLEAAFTAAGIPQKESWRAVGDSLLAQLEAETEAVRREYESSQLQPPTNEQPKPTAVLKPASTDQEIPKPAVNDASASSVQLPLADQQPKPTRTGQNAMEQRLKEALKSAEHLGSGSRNPQGTAKGPQEPQGADEDDVADVDEVEDGTAVSKETAASEPWNGWDWTGVVL